MAFPTLAKRFHPGPKWCRGIETRQVEHAERQWEHDRGLEPSSDRIARQRSEGQLYDQRYTPRFQLRGRSRRSR